MNLKVAIACLALWLLSSQCQAHAYHYSLAEITVNNERDVLEVAMRILPEQLEQALAQPGEQVNLDATENIDERIVRYLWKAFRVIAVAESQKSRKQLDLMWVGKEISHKAAWLYFEIDLAGAKKLLLVNNVLLDVGHGEQINTVVFTSGDKKWQLIFTVDTPPQSIVL